MLISAELTLVNRHGDGGFSSFTLQALALPFLWGELQKIEKDSMFEFYHLCSTFSEDECQGIFPDFAIDL